MTDLEKRWLPAEPIVAWGSFAVLLATYWTTVAPGVSFWDCPEYVAAAGLLEIGHPPGNPTWMLVERIVTMLVPARYAALAVNLSSGLLTAFAAFFLAKTIFRVALWVLLKLPRRHIPAPLAAAGAALTGALTFGWCDSVWYSAVEAEVYAMSIFMTSLCVWLMAKWAGTHNRGDSWRLLVLIAYLFGLSIGIHQLNLLCIPALAMIWAIRRGIRTTGKLLLIFLLSLLLVACILTGMMPATIALASEFELIAVNVLNLPALWGVAFYVVLLALSLLLALLAISRSDSRQAMAAASFPAIFLSGIFIFSDHFIVGLIISAVVAVLLVTGNNFKVRRLYLSMWMLAMLLTGYSSYALIPIRGDIPSPANSVMPGNPFSFAAYQSREQYGSSPLLYGPTPYSRPVVRESRDSSGRYSYRLYAIDWQSPVYVPKSEGGRLRVPSRGLEATDSLENLRLMARPGAAYILKGRRARQITTPELDMLFPRVNSGQPYDLAAYADWIGMDSTSMVDVEVSDAMDADGNFTTRKNSDGSPTRPRSLRPTYMHHLQWLMMYQTSYMYWRYLLWNFVGRQNDRPAQGEVQHGNFITGFPAVDNAMLGADDSLPPVAGKANKGRNRYFGLPLLLGIIGICWLLKSRRRGMQTCAAVAVLFAMTGLAITVYLNQGPGEPRERDYSFLGSYMAFCIWIGFGALAVARLCRSAWGFAIPLAVAGWMCFENYDDHDRSNRHAARSFAVSMLESTEPDAIIFVNGDNYTFPLWYAQEVEGVRTDVRVVNIAYLGSPVYAANLMKDWRESKGLATTLRRPDIIWDAFRSVSLPAVGGDTLPATQALERLRDSDRLRFATRYVSLFNDSTDDLFNTRIYDLRNLSATGSTAVDFGRLMMFDIVATNAAAPDPRPVYWLGAIGADRRIGLTRMADPWIFGYSLHAPADADSLLYEAAKKFVPPVPPGREAYMDRAPSVQTGAMRGALVYAAKKLLASGEIRKAVEIADKADIMEGAAPDSYGSIMMEDSIFNVRRELGRVLLDCADSLQAMAGRGFTIRQKGRILARSAELRARGRMHLDEYDQRAKAWQEYRRALPERLRNKMAPVY